jgi:hypothetical protein
MHLMLFASTALGVVPQKEVDTSSGSERLHLEGVLWVKPWLLFRQYRLVPYKVPIKVGLALWHGLPVRRAC